MRLISSTKRVTGETSTTGDTEVVGQETGSEERRIRGPSLRQHDLGGNEKYLDYIYVDPNRVF